MANLLKCEFKDGSVLKVAVDGVALHTGRGVNGAEYVNSLAERTDVVVCDCEHDASGLVILGSTERPLTAEEGALKTFAVRVLGADNGSGEFERGGDLDFSTVKCRDFTDLSDAILAALPTMTTARVYDKQTTHLGNHWVVSMSINEEGVGEQNFVFVATEVE